MNKELKEKLIFRRIDQVFCRIAPSSVHGVGILCIKKIPSGTNPFKGSFMAQEAIVVNKNKIKDPVILKLLNDHFPSNDNMQVVSNFPNQPIWTNYLNYSDDPNIELFEDGEWKTLRNIEVGEELFEDPTRLFNIDGTKKVFKVKEKQYPILHL